MTRTFISTIVLWVLVNSALFAVHGRQRILDDVRIAEAHTVIQKRAMAWGGTLADALPPFEIALDRAAQQHFEHVCLIAPAPRNVFESLAWHRLFPAVIDLIPTTERTVEAWIGEAKTRGADALLYPRSAFEWELVALKSYRVRDER